MLSASKDLASVKASLSGLTLTPTLTLCVEATCAEIPFYSPSTGILLKGSSRTSTNMSGYQYPGAGEQHQRRAQQPSLPAPAPGASYSARMPQTPQEQLLAASFGGAMGAPNPLAPNVLAPAALIYAPAVMSLYPPAPALTFGQHQPSVSSMPAFAQLHPLHHFQQQPANPYQQYSAGLLPLYQKPLYASVQPAPSALQLQVPPLPVPQQSSMLVGGGGVSTGSTRSQETSQQSMIGLSPASGPSQEAISRLSLLGLSQAAGFSVSAAAAAVVTESGVKGPTAAAVESAPNLSGPHGRSPTMEEQLQAEFEYTRLPSVPRRKDYAEMDAERPTKPMGKSKIFVRSKVRTQKGLDRRERKNASARANAASKRDLVEQLARRERGEMSKDEGDLLEKAEVARERKNRRSHESHTEKKNEIDRILSRTPAIRTPIEKKFLEQELSAKRRKNEGDRLRRLRLKELGFPPSRNTGKIGVPARGPIPTGFVPSNPQSGQAAAASADGGSVNTSSTTSGTPAAAAAAIPAGSDQVTEQSPANEGNLFTYGYQ